MYVYVSDLIAVTERPDFVSRHCRVSLQWAFPLAGMQHWSFYRGSLLGHGLRHLGQAVCEIIRSEIAISTNSLYEGGRLT